MRRDAGRVHQRRHTGGNCDEARRTFVAVRFRVLGLNAAIFYVPSLLHAFVFAHAPKFDAATTHSADLMHAPHFCVSGRDAFAVERTLTHSGRSRVVSEIIPRSRIRTLRGNAPKPTNALLATYYAAGFEHEYRNERTNAVTGMHRCHSVSFDFGGEFMNRA